MGRLIHRVAGALCVASLVGCGAAYSRRHVVAPGETVPAIARSQGVAEKDLRVFNHLSPGDRVKPGDVLFVPGPPGKGAAPPVARNPPVGKDPPAPPAGAEPPPVPQPDVRRARPPPPGASRSRLRWPLDGPVLRGFGTGPAGTSRGIDIAVATGTPVRAAEAGRVSYAGSPARAYAPLVIVDHPNDRHTVYGNLGRIGVQVGDRIEGGGVLGVSGGASGGLPPHLHFEVRETAEPRDPLLYLPPR